MTTPEPEQASPRESKVLAIFGYLFLAAGGATVASAAYLMRAGYSVVPYWDELDEMALYMAATHKSVLAWIWAQHNEHRLLFYKSLFIVDMHFFRGRNWPMYVAIFLSQAAVAVLIAYMLRQVGNLGKAVRYACIGLTLYCLFCASQSENFTCAFQLSFVLVNVWVVAAVLCLLIEKQRLAWGRPISTGILVLSLLAAVAATFSNGNGISVWPTLILVALLAKLPWRMVVLYLVGLACVVAVYLIGYYSPPQHASPIASLRQPRLLLEYVDKYLGGIVPRGFEEAAPLIGLMGLVIAAVLISRLIVQRGSSATLEYGLAGIVVYCVATAILTSLGRLNFGSNQAFASRYETFALLFWLGLCLWVIAIVAEQGNANLLVAVYLLLAMVMAYSATQYRRILHEVLLSTATRNLAGVGMITGVHDIKFLERAILPFPIAWPEIDEVRSQRLSLFSTPQARQFGQKFADVYRIGPEDACEGNPGLLFNVSANPNDVGVRGWAIERKNGEAVKRVVLVADGTIVGFAVPGFEPIGSSDESSAQHPRNSGWIGYAKLNGSPTLDFYAIVTNQQACHFGALRTGE